MCTAGPSELSIGRWEREEEKASSFLVFIGFWTIEDMIGGRSGG